MLKNSGYNTDVSVWCIECVLMMPHTHIERIHNLCYIISNCNAANIDIVALYLTESWNYNLHYTLEKLIFAVCINFFWQPFLCSVRRENCQMQPWEKRRQIQQQRKFFILIKVQNLLNTLLAFGLFFHHTSFA